MGDSALRLSALAASAALLFLLFLLAPVHSQAAAFTPDKEYQADQAALDELQRDAFRFFWEYHEPNSGMAYEANYPDSFRPIAVGGTGFGVAALVAATDRKWVGHAQAVERLLKIVRFLRDKTPRGQLHGAFPHWLDAAGNAVRFGDRDGGADVVETSLLMQGLLIARAYFNGPGLETELRTGITELWEDVDWAYFTNNEENGLYWHWDPERGFYNGLKILGYNECLITYVLAASSPTHPISRAAYDYWTSGPAYQARVIGDYVIEAAPSCGGPLFMAQYSFVGLDPRRLADGYVSKGYFVRSVKQTLANRGYCVYEAPPENLYARSFWGLSSCHTPNGYIASSPCNDNKTVAPTAALGSLPFTPHYSMQALRNLSGSLRSLAWGEYGPFDGVNLADNWASGFFLAVNQLPMVAMAENYRSGLLWDLFMADPDVRRGLELAGLHEPAHSEGLPELVAPYRGAEGGAEPDAVDLRRHPDSGLYEIPFFVETEGGVEFSLADDDGAVVFSRRLDAARGRNVLRFPQFMPRSGSALGLTMRTGGGEYELAVRLN